MENSLLLITTLIGVGVTILLAGVPWAYSIHGRLAAIESKIEQHHGLVQSIHEIDARVRVLESAGRRNGLDN